MPPKKNRQILVNNEDNDDDEHELTREQNDDNDENVDDDDEDDEDDDDEDDEDDDNDEDDEDDDNDEDENEDENEDNDDELKEDEMKKYGGNDDSYDEEKNDDDELEYEDSDAYKKISKYINKNELLKYHPECIVENYEEIRVMSNIALSEVHQTLPFLTKYERARVIGMRTVQLNNGAIPLIPDLPDSIIDNVIIAEKELNAKKIPYIICRPFSNGQKEYWKLEDLEIL
jgi:DNA-directed RNA polymerase subunit K/omega